MIFSMSMLMLWDNYQASQGNPTLFGISTQPVVSDSTSVQADGTSSSQVNDLPNPASITPLLGSQSEVQTSSQAVNGEVFTVRTEVLELDFSTQGGQVVGSRLLKHPDSERPEQPVQLFEQSSNRIYLGQVGLVGVKGAPNHRTIYELVQAGDVLDSQGNRVVQFQAVSGEVQNILTYSIPNKGYDISVKFDIKNLGEVVVSPSAYLQITRDSKPLESDSTFYATFTGPAVYSPEKKYEKVDFDDIEDNSADFAKSSTSGWIAMIQHYFVSAFIPQEGPRDNYSRKVEPGVYSIGSVSVVGNIQPGSSAQYNAILYTGPQDQRVLEKLATGLDLVVDYGWLTVVAQPIYWLLENIHSFVGNWGWSIILLTILIKAIFFPLSAASYKSMAKMRKVGPRMQKMKEQYGDDRMGFQRAMMDLYKREKINPLGGCMPILIQIPVFIALYWVLLASVEMRNAPWLGWITDLATPDPFYILPILMAVTMFIQIRLNPTPPDPMQAKLMMIMPIVFSVMFFFFPAGLVLYWVVNNILSITQQWVITKQIESGAVK
jgi:YidC/Oxa1 family membrane protein insertase